MSMLKAKQFSRQVFVFWYLKIFETLDQPLDLFFAALVVH